MTAVEISFALLLCLSYGGGFVNCILFDERARVFNQVFVFFYEGISSENILARFISVKWFFGLGEKKEKKITYVFEIFFLFRFQWENCPESFPSAYFTYGIIAQGRHGRCIVRPSGSDLWLYFHVTFYIPLKLFFKEKTKCRWKGK